MSEPLERLAALALKLKVAAMSERHPERRALLEETAEATTQAVEAVADALSLQLPPTSGLKR